MKCLAIAILIVAAAVNVQAAAYLQPVAYLHSPSAFNTNWSKLQVRVNWAWMYSLGRF
jgi:opacity protein-like surface antigen